MASSLGSLKYFSRVFDSFLKHRHTFFMRGTKMFFFNNADSRAGTNSLRTLEYKQSDYRELQDEANKWNFQKKIVCIAGHQFNPLTCIVLNDGSLLVRKPKKVVAPVPKFFRGVTQKQSVFTVSVGCAHAVLITMVGKAYVWGENNEGKLGLGKSSEHGTTVLNPVMINAEGVEHAIFVACSAGEAHTCLVDKDGVAYATGYGEGGRLGNSTCRSQHTFLPMSFRRRNRFALSLDENILALTTKNPPRIFAVECGRCWTLLLTLDGIPYGTGRNINGQMGYSYCAGDELPTNPRSNWSSPKPILLDLSRRKIPYTANMLNVFTLCKFVRAGYFQNRSFFIDYDNKLWVTPNRDESNHATFEQDRSLWDSLKILNTKKKFGHEILDAHVDSSIVKLVSTNAEGTRQPERSCYYYSLRDGKFATKTAVEDFKALLRRENLAVIHCNDNDVKKMVNTNDDSGGATRRIPLKLINVITKECTELQDVNSKEISSPKQETISIVQNMLQNPKSYHPNLTAYVVDNALDEQVCAKINSLRSKIELDLRRPTCARRFFKEWKGTQTQQERHSESGWVGQSFEKMFKNLGLPFHTMPWFRFLEYEDGGYMAKHSDGSNTHTVNNHIIRSTHTLLYYLSDCADGGETTLFRKFVGEKKKKKKRQAQANDLQEPSKAHQNVLEVVTAKRNRVLIFPHNCEHEGNRVGKDAKIALRAELYMHGEKFGCSRNNSVCWYDTEDYTNYLMSFNTRKFEKNKK
eukprot:g1286.t1